MNGLSKKLLLKIGSVVLTLGGAVVTVLINDAETKDLETRIYNKVMDNVMKNVDSTVPGGEVI